MTGAADSPLKRERCAQFGVLAGFTLKAVLGFIDALIERGLLSVDRTAEYPLVSVTAAGRTAVQSDEILLSNPLRLTDRRAERTTVVAEPISTSGAGGAEDEDDRYERLRAWRRIESNGKRCPRTLFFTMRPCVTLHVSTRQNSICPERSQASARAGWRVTARLFFSCSTASALILHNCDFSSYPLQIANI